MSRDINFGSSESDAKWQISDDGTPGDFVLARDTNGNTVLLKWSDANSQWEYGGTVDLAGNDLEDGATTVYDASTDTVGDGANTSADHTSVSTDDLDIAGNDLVATGDDLWAGPSQGSYSQSFSTTSSSYVNSNSFFELILQWDDDVPSGAQGRVRFSYGGDPGSDQIDVRLQNVTDSETIIEDTGRTSAGEVYSLANYTPTTTSSPIVLRIGIRNSDGSTSVTIVRPTVSVGVRV